MNYFFFKLDGVFLIGNIKISSKSEMVHKKSCQCQKSQYIYQDSKFLEDVVYFSELVLSAFYNVWAEQHALQTMAIWGCGVFKRGIFDFQSQFSMSKIIRISLNFFSLNNTNLGAHFLLLTFFDKTIFILFKLFRQTVKFKQHPKLVFFNEKKKKIEKDLDDF